MSDEQCQQITALLMSAVAALVQRFPVPPTDDSLMIQLSPDLPWRAYIYADGMVGVRAFNEMNVSITLARFNYRTGQIEQMLSSQYARLFVEVGLRQRR